MDEWNEKAKRLLRAEMTRTGVSYKGLADRLGGGENEANLRNKVSRGGFSAAFLLACLAAIGCTTIHL